MLPELALQHPHASDDHEREFPAIIDRPCLPDNGDDFLYYDMMNDRTELSIIETTLSPHLRPSAAAIAPITL
jgi:hypothetical protein